MREFLQKEGISYRDSGKVIVATSEVELPRLAALLDRGLSNGIRCRAISSDELREIEPHVSGIKAIHVSDAGVVDYHAVCRRLADILLDGGNHIVVNSRVVGLRESHNEITLGTTAGDIAAKIVVNCAGLFSDRIAMLSGPTDARILPFRGEYFEVRGESAELCRALVYPVPDPAFPFLGVHFTRSVHGIVECGPNAVPAFAREGYRRRDFNLRDTAAAVTYRGTWKLARKHWRTGAVEIWRSLNKSAFVRAVQRLIPGVRFDDLYPAPSGVRAQAVAEDGSLIDDFAITRRGRVVNVINAPSPAATASLAIGDLIADVLER